MEYNWADPKKNTKLSSLLMSKAEASRKKRLTSVRSTLSNQLHPSIENKLRKKKKALISARREADATDPIDVKHQEREDEGDQQSDNNDSHRPGGGLKERQKPRGPTKSLDTFQSHLQQQQRPESEQETSMFDAFDLNAAADGLFHPASTISAFIEHDAKYNSAVRSDRIDAKDGQKDGKSSRKTTPKGNSNEEPTAATSDKLLAGSASLLKELPVLSGRRSASSLRLLHTRGSSRSSSASSFASSSSSSRESTATRSDSDLLMLAPRRLGAIPSSADRSALDFYEHDGGESESESDGDEGQDTSVQCQAPADGDGLGNETGGGAFDLTTKFAALKEMFHHNQASRSGRGNDDQQPKASKEDRKDAGGKQPASPKSTTVKDHAALTGPTVNIKQGHISRTSAGKSGAAASTKAVSSGLPSVAGHSRSTKPSAPTWREAKVTTGVPASEKTETGNDGGAVDKKPKKKEGKAHSGISLTDLKEEHRAALALLKELGGPTDTEFRDEDMDRSIRLLAARSGKTASVGGAAAGRLGGGRGAVIHAATGKMLANSHGTSKAAASTSQQHTVGPTYHSDQQQHLLEPEEVESDGESPLRPLSSSSSGSLVSRLRSSIALGRVVSHGEATDDGDDDSEEEEAQGTSHSVGDADSSPHVSDITNHSNEQRAQPNNVNSDGDTYELGEAVRGAVEPENAVELQWKQYCANYDDMDAAGDEDDEEEEDGESTSERKKDPADESDDTVVMARGYTPVSSRSVDNRYSDEGFEADW